MKHLTDEQALIIRDILAESLKNVPDQIWARLGETAVLVAGIAVGVVVISDSHSEVIPMAICPKVDSEQMEALVRFVCADVGRVLLHTSEPAAMSAKQVAPSAMFGLGNVGKGVKGSA